MKTQIGLPVQLFANTTKGRETFAAIIVDLRDSPHAETDLVVFSRDEKPTSIFAPCIRHKDFKKDGENYWDFLEEETLTKKEVKTVISEKTSSEYEKFVNTFLSKFERYNAFFKSLDELNLAYKILDKVIAENEELLECKVFLHRFLSDFAPDEAFSPTYLALGKAYSLLPKLKEGSKPFLSKDKNNNNTIK
jgi:hypothetical protein